MKKQKLKEIREVLDVLDNEDAQIKAMITSWDNKGALKPKTVVIALPKDLQQEIKKYIYLQCNIMQE